MELLPINNIVKISKSVLPADGKISKDGKCLIQECVTEFVAFLTSEGTLRYLNVAVDDCLLRKKKTITGPDIINAMYKLGFEKYGDALKDYLDKYREQLENQSESLD